MLSIIVALTIAYWPKPSADLDHDGDVDMVDYAYLQREMGPAMPFCRYDLDNSGMIDAGDVAEFQRLATGATK